MYFCIRCVISILNAVQEGRGEESAAHLWDLEDLKAQQQIQKSQLMDNMKSLPSSSTSTGSSSAIVKFPKGLTSSEGSIGTTRVNILDLLGDDELIIDERFLLKPEDIIKFEKPPIASEAFGAVYQGELKVKHSTLIGRENNHPEENKAVVVVAAVKKPRKKKVNAQTWKEEAYVLR